MIVSNFTNGFPGALQGLDRLARSAAPAQKESSVSSFSELLGSSERPDSLVPSLRDSRLQSRGGKVASGTSSTADTKFGGQSSQSVDPSPVNAPTPERSGSSSALDDRPPVFRDPRLDDPDELALEAAAIALAASLLAKQQESAPVSVQTEELGGYLGSDQGGGKAGNSTYSEEVQAGASAPLALPIDEAAPLAQLQGTAEPVSAADLTPATLSGLHKAGDAQSVQAQAPTRPGAAPKFLSAVVLNATEQQAAALAEKGAEFVPAQKGVHTLGSDGGAAVVIPVTRADANRGAQQIVEPAVTHGQQARDSAPLSEQSGAKAISDAELLSSPNLSNPAAAFFAAQAPQPETQSTGQSAGLEPVGGDDVEQSLIPSLLSDADVDARAPRSLQLEAQGEGANGSSRQSKAPAAPATDGFQQSLDALVQEGSELGTFGAQEEVVHSEASPALERTEESSTPVTARVQDSSAFSAPSADFSTMPIASSLAADSSKHGPATVSRPTVLPPVQTRSSELFNVVQNALERARSENPSHLAVEVTLDDGSSFGLEVRMGASGLQASFRSESQPLLKVLESNWAGFLAKETAESKVVSAAFEGRSGFGEFSNNGSSAGERRQQFEDNSAAALLGARDGKSSSTFASVAEAEKKASSPEGGMAVYA